MNPSDLKSHLDPTGLRFHLDPSDLQFHFRETISEKDIKDILYNGKSPVSSTIFLRDNKIIIEDCHIEGPLIKDSGTIQMSEIIFLRCRFSGQVLFKNFDNISSVKFENCHLKKGAEFDGIKAPLEFLGCRLEKEIVITGNDMARLTIDNTQINGTVHLMGSFKEQIELDSLNKGLAEIGALHIISAQIEHLSIFQSSLISVRLLGGQSEISNISLLENNFLSLIVDLHSASNFRLERSTVKSFEVWFHKKGSNRLRLIECKIQIAELSVETIDHIETPECKFGSLTLSGINTAGKRLNFENSELESLVFDKLINEGKMSFKSLQVKTGGKISILSSDLGKSDFIMCDFSKASMEFDNSKLTEVFLSETDFPTKVLQTGNIKYPQAQLAFGQLNTTFQKQGDTVKALEYQAREIEAHYKYLKGLSLTKVSLFLNKISNDFGRNWGRGIIFSFGIGLICFYALVISSNEYSFGFGFKFNQGLIPAFFKFMNPLRFIETESLFKSVSGKPIISLTSWSYFWDFLGRVLVAYGFYQTIQAFRKYGRK